MTFSGAAASVAGFGLIGKRPGAFAVWCLVYVIGIVVIAIGAVATILPAILGAGAEASSLSQTSDPQAALAALARIWPSFILAFLVIGLLALMLAAILSCGVYRAMLRPKETGFGSIRIGADEFRMLGLYLIFTLIAIVLAIPFAIVFGIFAVILRAAGWTGIAMIYVLFLGLYVLIASRFGLAGPQTFYEKRITLTGSLELTGKAVGSMFLMAFLVVLITVGVAIVDLGLQFVLRGGSLTPSPDIGRAFLMMPVLLLITIVFGVLQMVLQTAPFAAAYKALSPRSDQADAFN
jgi:hypothetical protein